MKHLVKSWSLLLLVSMFMFTTSCDDDDSTPSENETQAELLKGTWKATSVTYEEAPVSDYADFTITISSTDNVTLNYTTAGKPAQKLSPWSNNGTFTFGTPATTQLIRDDETTIEYSATNAILQMSFNFTGDGYSTGGKTKSVGGDWVFVFQKQ